MDPHHLYADPHLNPAFHYDADPDKAFTKVSNMLMICKFRLECLQVLADLDPDPAIHFDADPDLDPTFHFDADPNPEPALKNYADLYRDLKH